MNRLYRSRSDKKLLGVCGGLASFLGVDATLVRLGFVVLTLVSGVPVLLYLVMLALMPREPYDTDARTWTGGLEATLDPALDREIEQLERRALKQEVYRLRSELTKYRTP